MQAVQAANGIVTFIKDEMSKRHLSARQFADLVEVSPSTITNVINERTEPSVQFLRNLAKATSTPLSVLIALAYPEVAGEIDALSPEVLLLAVRLSRLPPDLQKRVIAFVNGN